MIYYINVLLCLWSLYGMIKRYEIIYNFQRLEFQYRRDTAFKEFVTLLAIFILSIVIIIIGAVKSE